MAFRRRERMRAERGWRPCRLRFMPTWPKRYIAWPECGLSLTNVFRWIAMRREPPLGRRITLTADLKREPSRPFGFAAVEWRISIWPPKSRSRCHLPLLRTAMYGKGIQVYCAPTTDRRHNWHSSIIHVA